MKKDRFDDLIRQKVEGLQVEYQPEHWELFSERMDMAQGGQADVSNSEFDQAVFSKLNRYEASARERSRHWAILQQRMEAFTATRDLLLRYKLVEAILVSFFLLITIKVGMPEPKSGFDAPIAGFAPQQIPLSTDATVPVGEHASTPSAATSITPANSAQNPAKTRPAPLADQRIREGLTPPSAAAEPDIPRVGRMAQATLLPARVVAPSSGTDLGGTLQAFVVDVLPTEPMVPSLPLEQAPMAFSERSVSLPGLEGLKIKARTQVRVSMLGGADYNRVMTPENLNRRIRAYERVAVGYRGGLTLDFSRLNSRFAYGTGLIYTAKQYGVGYQRINGSLLRRNGLTAEELQHIELNIVNIPVFARYNLLHKQRWAMYMQAGLAMQVATQANYYVSYPDHLPQPIGVTLTPSRYSQIADRTSGFLEGGSFKENSFFTGNLGIGFERAMADRWMLFAQSRYEHSLGYLSDGFGPTQDRINTFTLETGVRVKLK